MSPRKFKTVGSFLVFMIAVFPVVALNCAESAMQNCHPCCANEDRPQVASAVEQSSHVAPCCMVPSDKQSQRTDSRTTSGTWSKAQSLAVAERLELPSRHLATNANRHSVVSQAPAQSSLCTFLI